MKKTIRIFAVVLSVLLLALALVACAPKNDPDKAKAALEKNGYTAVKTTGYVSGGYVSGVVSALLGGESTIDATVTGTKDIKDADGKTTKTESVTIIYYKTSADAKEAWKSWSEADRDRYEVAKCSGRMIYFGTKAAVKAAS